MQPRERLWRAQPLRWNGRFVHNWFSNFEACSRPVRLGGLEFPAAEQAYQAMKTADPDRRAAFSRMAAGPSKRAGRALEVRADWEDVKLAAMDACVRAKFAPGTRELDRLLAAGDAELVEWNNWGDRFWGADLRGRGRNALGLLLMLLRDEARAMGTVSPGAEEQEWAGRSLALCEVMDARPNLPREEAEAAPEQPRLL